MRTTRVLSGLLLIGAATLFNTGCSARAGVTGYARTGPPVYYSEPPTLLYIGPEIWVVRDAEYPIYYSDGYYWAYYGDTWYRSDTYDGGWLSVSLYTVPTRIIHRDHTAYIHYRGRGEPTRVAPRSAAMRPASLDQPPGRARGRYQQSQPVDRVPPGQQRRPEQPLSPGQQRRMEQPVLPPGQQHRMEQERRGPGPRADERGRGEPRRDEPAPGAAPRVHEQGRGHPPPQYQQQRQRGRSQSEERREQERQRGRR
jgi:hypothetical protein